MNFYWFGRHNNKDLGHVSDLLEDSGFYGWLIPYAAGQPDPFSRIARSLKTEQKLKYLVAVRPYTISHQYLLAISKSLDSIQEDRVRINFVPGLTYDEESYGGIFSEINDSSSFEDRKKYFCTYIEQWKNWDVKKPYTYISGMSDDICPDLDSFGDCTIVNYSRVVDKTLDHSDKTKIIFLPFSDYLEEELKIIKGLGYNNVMTHVLDKKDFDRALATVKNIKANETSL
jgi:hypothetical protein